MNDRVKVNAVRPPYGKETRAVGKIFYIADMRMTQVKVGTGKSAKKKNFNVFALKLYRDGKILKTLREIIETDVAFIDREVLPEERV